MTTINDQRIDECVAIQRTIRELNTFLNKSDKDVQRIFRPTVDNAIRQMTSKLERIQHVIAHNAFGFNCPLDCNGGWRADVSFPMHYDHVSVEDARQCDQGAWPCADHACYSVI